MSSETGQPRVASLTEISNGLRQPSQCSSQDSVRHRNSKGLSRAQSFRCLSQSRDSLDSVSSEADSIYDAEMIGAVQDLVPLESQIFPIGDAILSPPAARRNSPAAQSHSRWPQATLDPITERRSTASLTRSSSSVAKVAVEPTMRIAIPQAALYRELSRKRDAMSQVHESSSASDKGFSFHSLDCLPKSDTRPAQIVDRSKSSSASNDVLRNINSHPASPLQPHHALPIRPATPPGLPSFGTREAQEFRLTPESTYRRLISNFSQWFHSRNPLSDEEWSPRARVLHDATPPKAQTMLKPHMKALRRVFGAAGSLNMSTAEQHQRIRLPPGISLAIEPGPLAQAQDGTWIRGRWGQRASAHGVGNRNPNQHPLGRVNASQSIDSAVEEIDKACRQNQPSYQSHAHCQRLPPLGSSSNSALDDDNLFAHLQQFLLDSSSANATAGSSVMQEPVRYVPGTTSSNQAGVGATANEEMLEEGANSIASHIHASWTWTWKSCCTLKM